MAIKEAKKACDKKEGRRPLFLTPHSLSSKTAFGVQTKLLLGDIPEYHHAYWYSAELDNLDSRSIRLESMLFSRISIFKRERASRLVRAMACLGLSWWNGNTLKASRKRWLNNHFAHQLSAVYAAPSETRDCERMREILAALNKPFVLHLWDLLDEGQLESSALLWLLERATHVLCVSQEMARHLAPIRPDACVHCFSRRPSAVRAEPRDFQPFRIMLIGHCPPYISGLKVLNEALRLLKTSGHAVEIVYIGSKKATRQWAYQFDQEVIATGYVSLDDERDKLLAGGHIGFLPGPLNAPGNDLRSRLSIPSRVLDFLAAGLPLVATVHRDSATAGYLRRLELDDCTFGMNPNQLAERILALADPATWRVYSQRSHVAFAASRQPQSNLKELLEAAAVTHTL